jgi:hypothetical protein
VSSEEEVSQTQIQPKYAEPEKVNIRLKQTDVDDDDDDENAKLPQATPTEKFLSVRLEALKSQLDSAQTVINRMQGKEQALADSERENFELKRDLMHLRKQLQIGTNEKEASLSLQDRLEDARIECEQLIKKNEMLSSDLEKSQSVSQRMAGFVSEIRQCLESNQNAVIPIDEIRARFNLEGNVIVWEFEKVIATVHCLSQIVEDRQVQIERIGLQQQEVVAKWNSFAGKIVKISPDGDVEEIDLNRIRADSNRYNQQAAVNNAEADIELVKSGFEASLNILRQDNRLLKEQLERDRADKLHPTGSLPDAINLEQQLVEAKVKLANLADAFNSLEQENQQIKETMSNQDFFSDSTNR